MKVRNFFDFRGPLCPAGSESGSSRPKSMRIRIRNTAFFSLSCRNSSEAMCLLSQKSVYAIFFQKQTLFGKTRQTFYKLSVKSRVVDPFQQTIPSLQNFNMRTVQNIENSECRQELL